MIRELFAKVFALPGKLLGGSRGWGHVRLAVLLLGAYLFMRWGRFVWTEPGTNPIPFYWRAGLRFLVFPSAALLAALLVAASYVRRLYDLPDMKAALRYMIASAFAYSYPRLDIVDGEKDLDPEETNLVDAIGGPGYIKVRPGSAVMLERLTEPSSVHGAGMHFVSRLERVRESVSLADQHGVIGEISCTTKDGIEVVVRNVQYRYRLLANRRPLGQGRTLEDPYPFSRKALRDMVYGRAATAEGLTPWAKAVSLGVDGVISDYVREHLFDQVTTPGGMDDDPRAEIAKQMTAKGLRDRLREVGAELLWFDIGTIEPVDEKVAKQRLEKWGVKWKGQAKITRAYADAQRLAQQELGRAEAQANLIVAIMDALEEVTISGDPNQNLHGIVVARTAQVLEAWTERGKTEWEDDT